MTKQQKLILAAGLFVVAAAVIGWQLLGGGGGGGAGGATVIDPAKIKAPAAGDNAAAPSRGGARMAPAPAGDAK